MTCRFGLRMGADRGDGIVVVGGVPYPVEKRQLSLAKGLSSTRLNPLIADFAVQATSNRLGASVALASVASARPEVRPACLS